MSIPVEVVNGKFAGPRLWLSAALHGDEVNGVEIVRELLARIEPDTLCGAVIAVPTVNVFGFINGSRYLPDRRDLNRSFPGSKKGSLAARLARLFLEEIVTQSTHGIDLHTGAVGRYNHPHIRGNLNDPETRRIAAAFGAPVMMSAPAPVGSLRHTAANRGIPILLFEGGEAQRFDSYPVAVGLAGIQRVMDELGMYRHTPAPVSHDLLESKTSTWLRAKRAGILRLAFESGDFVKKKQLLGTIGDVFEREVIKISAPFDGIILSHVTHPLVHQGDAILHIAQLS
ncbi:MAG: succinylglutamate desuccinylase/aspartoacylase family protein [Bradymonadaceae bacterium]|nr:succinylglutamate desuccinylase/aspartoacylase family protein [Lujinxingiaceae bacterium]